MWWWHAVKILCAILLPLFHLNCYQAKVLFISDYDKLLEYFPSARSIPLLPPNYSSVFFRGCLRSDKIDQFPKTLPQFRHFQQVDGVFHALYSSSSKNDSSTTRRVPLVPRNPRDLLPDSINRPYSKINYENYVTIDSLVSFDPDEFLFRLCITVSKFFHFSSCKNDLLKQKITEHLDDKEFEEKAKEIKTYTGNLISHFLFTKDCSQDIVHMNPIFNLIETNLGRNTKRIKFTELSDGNILWGIEVPTLIEQHSNLDGVFRTTLLKGWIINENGYQIINSTSLKAFLSNIKLIYQSCKDFDQFVFFTNFLLLDQYRNNTLSPPNQTIIEELDEEKIEFFTDLDIQLISSKKLELVTGKFIKILRGLVNFILDYRHPFFKQAVLPSFNDEMKDILKDIYIYLKHYFAYDGHFNKNIIQGDSTHPLLSHYTLSTQIIQLFYVEIISKL